jgi:hypothetical protein
LLSNAEEEAQNVVELYLALSAVLHDCSTEKRWATPNIEAFPLEDTII